MSPFVVAILLALTFSSCTCSSSTPEAPPTPQPRSGGFGGMLKPTERSVPEVAKGEVTPEPVETRQAPTLPAAPSEAKLPEDFPSDVPVFEGAKVAGVQQLANNARNVIFTVDDAEAPKVFDFYKGDMEHSGWKTEQEFRGGDQSFLSFKKDKMITNVSISKDPKSGKRVIAVMYYKEEPLPFPEF
ncbi:MAG TPA: hypothetical protein VL049_14520 [Candidatus Dormibacteraeota bacterium]|nr:hypothetical protein [Candidatus Dormibacteraeota bacterium]